MWRRTRVRLPLTFLVGLAAFAIALPAGGAATTLNFSVVGTNSAKVASAPSTTSITVTPPADVVAIQTVEYRTGNQRLIVNATSSVVSPTVVLTLQPYKTSTGATFDPAGANTFTNNGAGAYILTLVGVPEPAIPPATPIVVKSSAGGISPPLGLTKIRQ